MKKYILILFVILTGSCSKQSSLSSNPIQMGPPETSERIGPKMIELANQRYLLSLKNFENSSLLKLETKISLFEMYKNAVTEYLNLLLLIMDRQEEILQIKNVFKKNAEINQRTEALFKKLSDSKLSLLNSGKKIEIIQKQTKDFQLTEITELGLRDELLSAKAIYRKNAEFLILTFQSEMTEHEIKEINDNLFRNEEFSYIFDPYLVLKNGLDLSENELSRIGFSFLNSDHTIAGLTHEDSFFKTIEEHIESIESFKRDASIFLNTQDFKKLNNQILKLKNTLGSLQEMREFQMAIKADLTKIWLLGYDLPKNIENLKEEELKWQTKEVFVAEQMPLRGEWQIGYHIVGPRVDATPADHLTHERYYYQLVNKTTYPAFDDAFGTAFTRLMEYLSKYENKIPKLKDSHYTNIASLLVDTFTIVTDYIDQLN